MQNRIGNIARHIDTIATRLRIKRTTWDSRGEKRKRRDEKEGNGESTGTRGKIAAILLAQQCKSL